MAAEPEAVHELVACCGGFPLALCIVAGQARTHPGFRLADLAGALRDRVDRLGALDEHDPAASLPMVMSWSYHAMPPEQARAFGLLGIAPGPDIGLPAAADLLGVPPAEATSTLRALERVSLVQQDVPGRWRMHDLVRLYAAERANQDQPEAERDAALRRLTDFYIQTGHTGALIVDIHRKLVDFPPPVAGCHPLPLHDEPEAMAWFTAEHPCLLAVQRHAADRGWHDQVWQVAWILETYHRRRGLLHDELAVWQAGLAAANQLANAEIQATAHRLLAYPYTQLDRPAEAIEHLRESLVWAEREADVASQARTHRALARAWEQRGELRPALEHAVRSLELFRTLDDPVGQARALNMVGWRHVRLGNHDEAHGYCRDALALCRDHRDRVGEADARHNLGYIAYESGRYAEVLEHFGSALELYRELGNTYRESIALDRLAGTHATLGHADAARAAWLRALALYQAQDRAADADRVRRRLDELS